MNLKFDKIAQWQLWTSRVVHAPLLKVIFVFPNMQAAHAQYHLFIKINIAYVFFFRITQI